MKFEDMINKVINCDCYEMIKNIPDKSIDCVYIDIPYEMQSGGKGSGAFGDRVHKVYQYKHKDRKAHV